MIAALAIFIIAFFVIGFIGFLLLGAAFLSWISKKETLSLFFPAALILWIISASVIQSYGSNTITSVTAGFVFTITYAYLSCVLAVILNDLS